MLTVNIVYLPAHTYRSGILMLWPSMLGSIVTFHPGSCSSLVSTASGLVSPKLQGWYQVFLVLCEQWTYRYITLHETNISSEILWDNLPLQKERRHEVYFLSVAVMWYDSAGEWECIYPSVVGGGRFVNGPWGMLNQKNTPEKTHGGKNVIISILDGYEGSNLDLIRLVVPWFVGRAWLVSKAFVGWGIWI